VGSLRHKQAIQLSWRINMDKGTNEYDADEPVMGYNGYFFELDEEDE